MRKAINAALLLLNFGVFFWIIAENSAVLINVWDEALYANNALQMKHNHQWLTYYNYGMVDNHNTKPPLMIWLQIVSFGIFGVSEFSVRFPTYVAFVALCVVAVIWLERRTGSYIPGLLFSALSVSSQFLIQKHVFLTGDLDGMLVFLEFCLILCTANLASRSNEDLYARDYWLLFGLFFLAWLCKSTSVFLWIPSLALLLLMHRRLGSFLKSRYFLYGTIITVLLIGFYYGFRSFKAPGYWATVWRTEFSRMAVNPQPWFDWGRDFYYNMLLDAEKPLYWLLIVGFVLLFFVKAAPHRRMIFSLGAAGLLFGILISLSPSKMAYYAAPFYPLFYLLVVFTCWDIYTSLGTFHKRKMVADGLICAVFTVFFVARIVQFQAYLPAHFKDRPNLEDEAYLYQMKRPALAHADSVVFFRRTDAKFRHHDDALEFYVLQHRHTSDQKLVISGVLNPGDFALISNPKYFEAAKSDYHMQILDSTQIGVLVLVK